MARCVIVGASHAAAQVVFSLRQLKYEGEIVLVGDEPYLPYNRPPLSKTFLSGDVSIDQILIRPEKAYEKAEVTLKLGRRAIAVDATAKELTLDDGEVIPYDKLVLATGSKARQVSLPGSDLNGLHYLRTIEDVEAIRQRVAPGSRAVIVGGGYIGLETAAAMRKLGMEVTVLEAMSRILQRVTAPKLSEFYHRVHTEEGVSIHVDAMVSSIVGDKNVAAVTTADGAEYPADVVVVGIGILPEVDLAESAGVDVDNGILVNEFAETSNPDILACGDCTSHFNPIYQRQIRLESVQNAVDQAKVVAATICGKRDAYSALPWFWSDQYDIKLQIAGLSQGFDRVVVRGDIDAGRSFAAFYLLGDQLLAVDAVNRPQEFMIGRRLLSQGISPPAEMLADDGVDVKSLINA
ncbi:putidaredoxin reductase [Luminiphilus syltensis NOR5-1B]|uniref:Putidaredoxin reductase n=1 Tax=Luminiphilus syltensis NOR5-1B TaxID=565045 RepID=B8KSA7_9GAMM|nr:FAD/NAD(P)-binding oxidoreductase [Luminiphilus syltensis]EED34423.1 putidaredoxin reductase [Luminiphilus syltensis NOR5-1B]